MLFSRLYFIKLTLTGQFIYLKATTFTKTVCMGISSFSLSIEKCYVFYQEKSDLIPSDFVRLFFLSFFILRKYRNRTLSRYRDIIYSLQSINLYKNGPLEKHTIVIDKLDIFINSGAFSMKM